jgi:hypothetical protein
MKITKQKLRQIIKEELGAAESAPDPEEAIYAALVNYAADKMRHGLEAMNYDYHTTEQEARNHLLKLVNDALEEAADIEL